MDNYPTPLTRHQIRYKKDREKQLARTRLGLPKFYRFTITHPQIAEMLDRQSRRVARLFGI